MKYMYLLFLFVGFLLLINFSSKEYFTNGDIPKDMKSVNFLFLEKCSDGKLYNTNKSFMILVGLSGKFLWEMKPQANKGCVSSLPGSSGNIMLGDYYEWVEDGSSGSYFVTIPPDNTTSDPKAAFNKIVSKWSDFSKWSCCQPI